MKNCYRSHLLACGRGEDMFLIAVFGVLGFIVIIFFISTMEHNERQAEQEDNGQQQAQPVKSQKDEFYDIMTYLLECNVIKYHEFTEIERKAQPYLKK